jgi:hypothetical protein
MEFKGSVNVAPNCPGRLYFVQYVKPDLKLISCGSKGAEGLCASIASWRVDTDWPYLAGSKESTAKDKATLIDIQTRDSPGQNNISMHDFVRVCINHEFVTYIVFEDGNGNLTSLGWMNWKFTGFAWRDTGTCPLTSNTPDCAGWQTSGKGEKLRENFTPGSMGPQALDHSVAVITAALIPPSDCSEAECPAP